MKKFVMLIAPLTVAVTLFGTQALAEEIIFPEEELAQESVYPKFDSKDVIKGRTVITDGKFELGLYGGANFNEPIYNQMKFGFNAGYHLSEDSALSLNYAQWMSGLNAQYTDQLKKTNGLDFSRVPQLKYSMYGHYEWKMFYGKISLTKQGVMNLSLYPILGVGTTAYEGKNYLGVDVGLGQKYYFGKSFALRIDYKLQYSQGVNPFITGVNTAQPGDFPAKWSVNSIFDFGFSFLL